MSESYSLEILKKELDRLNNNPTEAENEDEFTSDKTNDLYWTIKHLEGWIEECEEEPPETDYGPY